MSASTLQVSLNVKREVEVMVRSGRAGTCRDGRRDAAGGQSQRSVAMMYKQGQRGFNTGKMQFFFLIFESPYPDLNKERRVAVTCCTTYSSKP